MVMFADQLINHYLEKSNIALVIIIIVWVCVSVLASWYTKIMIYQNQRGSEQLRGYYKVLWRYIITLQ